MKKLLLLSAGLAALSATMFGDSIYAPSSNGTVSGNQLLVESTYLPGGSMPQIAWVAGTAANPTNTQVPFWNNPSSDTTGLANGHLANVAAVLSGEATGTDLIGAGLSGTPGSTSTVLGSYYAATASNGAGGDPAATSAGTSMTPALDFAFQSTQTAFTISLLFADSGNNSGVTGQATSIGTYIMLGGVFTPATVIDSAVSNNTTGTPQALTVSNPDLVVNAGTVYGFYATVCYSWNGTSCTASVTYTTDNGNFSTNMSAGNAMLGSLGWNHFALFELADGEEVLGFEDTPWALNTTNATEGIGDFNDVVIGLVGNPAIITASAPEPGTIAIMGLGLAGLGLIGRRRYAKK